MAGCSDDCDCVVEGSDGLQADGIGTPVSPFTVHPESGRTIPITVPTASILPTATIAHKGMFAWVENTHLAYVCTGTSWEPLGMEWRQVYPDPVTISQLAPLYTQAAPTIDLTPGVWMISARGLHEITTDAPGAGNPASFVDSEIQLVDVTNNDVLTNMFTRVTDATYPDNIGSSWAIPFYLQNIHLVTSTITAAMRASYNTGSTATNSMLVALNLSAVRLANHAF